MKVSKEHLIDRIEYNIKHIFYYLEYPDGVLESFWKDREGHRIHMPDMEIDYLKACILLVEKNIQEYNNKKLKDIAFESVRNSLIPLAEKKLKELKDEFTNKTNL